MNNLTIKINPLILNYRTKDSQIKLAFTYKKLGLNNNHIM